MADVFEVLPLLSGLKCAVTSVAAFRSSLYVGCDDGSLRAYDVSSGEAPKLSRGWFFLPCDIQPHSSLSFSPPAGTARPRAELVETVARFTRDKKPVRGLQVVPEWNCLLSLAGEKRRRVVAESRTIPPLLGVER
jgi:hypothetical protein